MADEVIQLAHSRRVKRVAVTTTAPAHGPTQPVPYLGQVGNPAAGAFAVTDGRMETALQQGVSPRVKLLAGRTATGTYTLIVYGWVPVEGGWLVIPLYKASVAATQAPGGTANANGFGTGETQANAITPDAAYTTGHVTRSGLDGPAVVLLDTLGCPFLTFYSSDAAAFVLVGQTGP